MSSKINDLANNVSPAPGSTISHLPQSLANGTNNGTGVDMAGAANNQCFAIQICATVAGTVDGKLQESDALASGYADISGATFTQVGPSNDDGALIINFQRTKRYVRAVTVVAGGAVIMSTMIFGQKSFFES